MKANKIMQKKYIKIAVTERQDWGKFLKPAPYTQKDNVSKG